VRGTLSSLEKHGHNMYALGESEGRTFLKENNREKEDSDGIEGQEGERRSGEGGLVECCFEEESHSNGGDTKNLQKGNEKLVAVPGRGALLPLDQQGGRVVKGKEETKGLRQRGRSLGQVIGRERPWGNCGKDTSAGGYGCKDSLGQGKRGFLVWF